MTNSMHITEAKRCGLEAEQKLSSRSSLEWTRDLSAPRIIQVQVQVHVTGTGNKDGCLEG